MGRGEDDANRAPGFHHMAGRSQLARRLVDTERDYGVTVLIGGVKESSERIEREETRPCALAQLPCHRRKHAIGLIDGESHDAVVTAIRPENESPRRRGKDLGAGVVAGKGARQCRNHLQRCLTRDPCGRR